MRPYKYQALQDYLCDCGKERLQLSFAEIAQICGMNKLPESAFQYPACWDNGAYHSQSKSWYHAGYTVSADIQKQCVVFIKKSEKNEVIKRNTPTRYRRSKPQICTLDIQTAVSEMQKYYCTTKQGEHTRYLSWEHCRRAFAENWSDPSKTEYLCLHLAWYLASWGMLRNSFLFQNDYLIHKEVVAKLCAEAYAALFTENIPNIDLVMQAAEVVRTGYGEHKVSETLVTKILLGIFGCVPAYDRYFKNAVKKYGISATFNAKSLTGLWDYFMQYESIINSACAKTEIPLDLYTPMKLMDMCFWQIGFDMDKQRDGE